MPHETDVRAGAAMLGEGVVSAGGVVSGGGVEAGDVVGRGGREARRASVLMDPPFPRTRAGGPPRSSAGPFHLCGREPRHGHAYPYRWTVTPGRARRGKVVPPCVRVTLRVDPGPQGTSPGPRGICPERPPTLR